MAHPIESGTLTLEDVREAEKALAAAWQSPVAIHSVCRARGMARLGAAKESRSRAPFALAHGLV